MAVNWPSLKSLVLFGSNLDAWIDLWAEYMDILDVAPFEVQIFQLSIVGTGGQEQRLSHSSALWIHNVVYLFSPVDMFLKNIEMKEAGDWDLIRGAIDDTLLDGFILINRNNTQDDPFNIGLDGI